MYHLETKIESQGENITLNGTANARFEKFEISGNSSQETRSGYNIVNLNSDKYAKDGVTITPNADGSITLNGTTTKGTDLILTKNKITGNPFYTFEDGKYLLKTIVVSGSFSNPANKEVQTICVGKTGEKINYGLLINRINENEYNQIATRSTLDKLSYAKIYVSDAGITFNNFTIKILLAKTEDVNLEWEPYGVMPSPEYPSPIQNVGNNINILNKNNILSRNGVKTEILETGIRIIDTSQSKFEYVGILLGGKELLEKNITCYSDVFKDKNIYSNAELYFGKASAPTSGGIIQKQNVSSSITWNIPSSFPNGSDQISIYLYISGGNPPYSGYSVDYTNLKVEIGDTPTGYSPYGLGNISTIISNKNAFNLKRLIEMSSKYSKIENGYKFSSTTAMYSKGISCLYPISLPISMSYKIQNLTGKGFRFKFWFDNGKTESLNAYSSGTSSEETNIVINNYTKSRCKTNCKNRY